MINPRNPRPRNLRNFNTSKMVKVTSHMSKKITAIIITTACLGMITAPVLAGGASTDEHGNRTSRISYEAVANLDVDNFVQRPKPLLELTGRLE